MRKPIDIVLPDTGPLISMAVADRLDLFHSFEQSFVRTAPPRWQAPSSPPFR